MTSLAVSPRVHALIEVRPTDLEGACLARPGWVSDALRQCAWMVVRRAPAPEERIAVGVRGKDRSQRWPGFAKKQQVLRAIAPQELRFEMANKLRRKLPAMRALQIIEKELNFLGMPWGPGGSVAHELASGQEVVRNESDLDLVIYADRPIACDWARDSCKAMTLLPADIDIKIETAFCGFSLYEYIQNTSQCLVRTRVGPKLVDDPWNLTE